MSFPTLESIKTAKERISKYSKQTPVLTSERINKIAGAKLYFKCENFQKTGSFKFRGALNAIMSLDLNELKKGVATHSSGNHAVALSYAANIYGAKALVAMPKSAPAIKAKTVEEYGGKIIFCEPSVEARVKTLKEIVESTGAREIHSSNDFRIIEGQGTATLELLSETPDLDLVLTPIGGGGLASGACLAGKAISPRVKIIGVEPEVADDALRSLKAGKIFPSTYPETIADGLRTSLGDKTFEILKKNIDDIVSVSETSIESAMKIIWERMKIVIEASSAVVLAAILDKKINCENKKVGLLLSGGNVDLNKLPWNKKE